MNYKQMHCCLFYLMYSSSLSKLITNITHDLTAGVTFFLPPHHRLISFSDFTFTNFHLCSSTPEDLKPLLCKICEVPIKLPLEFILYVYTYLRVAWVILLARGTPLVPTKEAGRGRELRGAAGWLVLAFRGCGKKLLLDLRG